jgi:8-oxo-dGTP diphosphatase
VPASRSRSHTGWPSEPHSCRRRSRGQRRASARRAAPQAGRWLGVPGGKIEPGESPAAAVERELREELDVTVRAVSPVASARDDRIELQLWQAVLVARTPEPRDDHDAVTWLAADELDTVPWLPVDDELLEAVRTLLAQSSAAPPEGHNAR